MNPSQPMFRSLTIELICNDCKRKAMESGEKVDICPHKRSVIPPWKADEGRNAKIKQLMAHDAEKYATEHLGVVSSTDTKAFEGATLDSFHARRLNFSAFFEGIKEVFLAVDTAGGGDNCMALVSGFYTPTGILLLLSLDTVQTTSDTELEQELDSHMERLRDRFMLTNTEFVSIIESNYGGWVMSSRVAAILARHHPIRHVTSDRTGMKRPGCCRHSSG